MPVQGTQPISKERWQRIKDVFEAVLETPREQRSSAVAQLCQGDVSLCAQVESLLAGLDKADGFMERPAIAGVAADFGASQQIFRVGDVVSTRFKIVNFIGQGGMGEVYEVEDLEIGTKVALKTIRPEIASDPESLARFKQELQLTRLVTHPNVCRTFDLAHHTVAATESTPAKNVTYLTMELLEGETLAERLRRGRMTTEEALLLIRQMADALDAAHSVGVIHRDFKPANVILCRRSSAFRSATLRAVVTDFGLARSFFSVKEVSQSLTRRGQVIGTPAYMAPEQIEGNEATPATDIYAFGLIIYEMVTGERPFAAEPAFGNLVQRLKEPPPSPRKRVPSLPLQWEQVILRCLEILPERRFENTTEIIKLLQLAEKGLRSIGSLAIHRFSGRFKKISSKSLLLAGTLFVLAAAWAKRSVWLEWSQTSLHRVAKLELDQFTSDSGLTEHPAVSFDGRIVAYASDRAGDGILNIWVQYVTGGPPAQVTHESYHALEPACSPDGSEIAFRSDHDGGIYIVSSFGGNKRLVAIDGRQPRFSPDGKQLLYWSGDSTGDPSRPFFRPSGKIYVVPAAGGTPRQLQKHFADARSPIWLPDGKHLLFQGAQIASGSVLESSDWWIADLDQPERAIKTGAFEILQKNLIVPFEAPPAWWNNTIIFAARQAGHAFENQNLFQFHLLPNTRRVNGDPERLTFGTGVDIDPSISRTGELFFTSMNVAVNIWALPSKYAASGLTKEKDLLQLTSGPSMDARPSISLDGERLLFGRVWGKDRNLWLKDLRTKAEISLTSADTPGAVMSRDGAYIAYSLYEKPKRPIEITSQGTVGPQRVCDDCGEPLDWSSDGSTLLYSFGQQQSLGFLDLKSGRKTALSKNGSNLTSASFGALDRYIVFAEWFDGHHAKLWLAPLHDHLPGPENEWIALTDGQFADDKPRTSIDGRTVYFQSDRDGFTCLWRMAIDPFRERVYGMPVPLLHFHRANSSLRELSRVAFNLSAAHDKIVFNFVSSTANLWRTQLP